MKTYSIFLLIFLSLVALSVVVWIGRPGKPVAATLAEPEPNKEDLPMPKSGPYGKAEVAETEFDFGVRSAGESDQHTFQLKNAGEGQLEFLLGKPSCQCTLGEIVKDTGEVVREGMESKVKQGVLQPGESANIRVKWEMKMHNDAFRQLVPVFTTDPDRRKIEFSIKGIIANLYEIRPDGVWNVGDILSDTPAKAEGFFGSKMLDQFTLTEEPRENSKLKVTIEPVDELTSRMNELKSGYKILVEVSPDLPFGRFRETFQLKSVAGERIKLTDFTIVGNKPGPIEVRGVTGAGFNPESDRLIFKDFLASAGTTATMTLFVKGFEGDLQILSVEPESSRVKFSLVDSGIVLGKSKAYKVKAEIEPGPAASHRGYEAEPVNLKLNHPQVPDFKLLIDYNAFR